MGSFAALGANPIVDVDALVGNVPIGWLQQGRVQKRDIDAAATYEFSPKVIQENLSAHIKENDIALAATTPVLGQYAPTFGWPESHSDG